MSMIPPCSRMLAYLRMKTEEQVGRIKIEPDEVDKMSIKLECLTKEKLPEEVIIKK